MSNAINLRNTTSEQQLAIIKKNNPELKALLDVYPPEQLDKLMSNKQKLGNIVKVMEGGLAVYTSLNSMIMNCSQGCPFRDVCILIKNDIAPFGYPCPVEKKLVAELESDVIESLGIDRNDPIEMEMLWDMIDTKLLDMRASGALKDGRLVQVVEQKVGQAISTREEISPTLEIKLELKKLKHQVIDSFVGTRRAKKKYGMQSDVNTIEQMIIEAAKHANRSPEA
jgi:hypothetical protein